MKNTRILHGNIIYSTSLTQLAAKEDAFLVMEDGLCAGVFDALPESFPKDKIEDYGEALIIPGLVDLHLHAPQFAYRGLGMDLDLIDWLNTVTFPEEAKYAHVAYAQKAYELFVDTLRSTATTRMAVFGTVHSEATVQLARLLSEAGFGAYVGKVNMDRNAPDSLREESAAASYRETLDYLQKLSTLKSLGKISDRVKPILTPRFVPSCTPQLMENLGELAGEQHLPVQSHLSESKREIAWVKELEPGFENYGAVYAAYGMMGNPHPSIMAHCIWSDEKEVEMMRRGGVYVAHCPQSNTNLASGIAPVRHYLETGLHVGLGTDVAGGYSHSVLRTMADAIQASKLYFRCVDESKKPLTLPEVFYLGTLGGGSFFGKVGTFEKGYEADAVILDDSAIKTGYEMTLSQRIERAVYLSEYCRVTAKYVAGQRVL